MKFEVTVTEKQLAAIWAKTEWNNPYEQYYNSTDDMWEFFYLTERCPDVVKSRFPSVSCDNEDANEILNLMDKWWRGVVIDRYLGEHEEIRGAFNNWWWSNHDVTDYEEEE